MFLAKRPTTKFSASENKDIPRKHPKIFVIKNSNSKIHLQAVFGTDAMVSASAT